ncbi:unnamed protein product, partial [marine sediment metagenome]
LTNLIQLSILINNSVLFIGMSLNDPNIIRLLQISWNIGVRHWHTAIMRARKTKRENEEITKRLRNCLVEPLWVTHLSQIDKILKSIRISKPFNSGVDTVYYGR